MFTRFFRCSLLSVVLLLVLVSPASAQDNVPVPSGLPVDLSSVEQVQLVGVGQTSESKDCPIQQIPVVDGEIVDYLRVHCPEGLGEVGGVTHFLFGDDETISVTEEFSFVVDTWNVYGATHGEVWPFLATDNEGATLICVLIHAELDRFRWVCLGTPATPDPEADS